MIVEPNSMIEEASVGYKSKVGPFAHVGPQATLEKNVEIGNYSERLYYFFFKNVINFFGIFR